MTRAEAKRLTLQVLPTEHQFSFEILAQGDVPISPRTQFKFKGKVYEITKLDYDHHIAEVVTRKGVPVFSLPEMAARLSRKAARFKPKHQP